MNDPSGVPERDASFPDAHAGNPSPSLTPAHIPWYARPFREWPSGLRVTIWFVLTAALLFLTFSVLGRFLTVNVQAFDVHQLLPREVLMALMLFASTAIMGRLERRPFGDYGIPWRRAFRGTFWEGLLWGFAMMSVVLGVLRLAGAFKLDSMALHGGEALKFAGLWGLFFLFVGFFEEFSFRGYIQFTVSNAWKFWPTAIMYSCLFGAVHLGNSGENVIGIAQVVVIGLVLCLTLRRTGDLWFAIGMHAAWDWAETYFYGVPDSGMLGPGRLLNTSFRGPTWLTGGSAGPEGSAIALVVILVAAYAVHRRFPVVRYPQLERPLP